MTEATEHEQNLRSDIPFQGASVALVVKNLPTSAGDVRHLGSIPGSGRSPGGWHGNPLQYSCLENPMDSCSPVGHKKSDTTEATQPACTWITKMKTIAFSYQLIWKKQSN